MINIINNIFKNINININGNYLRKIYDKIHNFDTTCQFNINKVILSDNTLFLKNISQLQFSSKKIINDISKFKNCDVYIINDQNEQNKQKLTIYIPNNINDNQQKFILFTSKCILLTRIVLININKIFKDNENYKIIFYPSNLKKIFRYHKLYLNIDEINSGETGFDLSVIFRFEECLKVSLHETIHSLGIFFKVFDNNNFNYISIKSGLNNKILISETIVETIAVIFNSYINSNDYSNFLDNIRMEILFGIFQTSKIFYRFNLNTIQDFFKSYKQNNNIIQKTAAVEYFIFKTYLLYYLDDFINILFNSNNIDELYEKSYNIIIRLLNNKINNDWFAIGILQGINFIKKNLLCFDPDINKLINTFRMTLIDKFDYNVQYGGNYFKKKYKLVKN